MIAFQWLDVDWYNDCTNVDEFIKLTLDVDVDAEGTKLVTGIIDDDEDVPGNEPLVDWMVDASVTSTSLSLSLLVSVSVWLSSLRSNSRISQANNAGFSCRKRSIRLTMFGVELLFRLLFLPPPFRRLTTMNFWIDKNMDGYTYSDDWFPVWSILRWWWVFVLLNWIEYHLPVS